ncbi:MAG: Methionyl-tRNA formyltransferase [Firmicutes bacterium]|nr:Methionyl-tRNA formyltransferase [candidate division NPL-UPA2 bacterium]
MKQAVSKRIVFMGTPEFAVPALRALHGEGHTVVAVFTQPDRPAGRGRRLTSPPVKLSALELGLPVWQPCSLRNSEVLDFLRGQSLDVIVVAAYAKLLPTAVLAVPRFGCQNIHASLLPKYRGGAPIHWAIVNGERETGVTIMQMARGLDTGDIIEQRAIPITPEDTCGSVTAKLALLGAELMLRVVALPDAGQQQRTAQAHDLMSTARTVRKLDGLINWSLDSRQIDALVRGMHPWPGAYTHWRQGVLGILATCPTAGGPALPPGTVSCQDGRLWVGCRDGSIELQKVLPAGKRVMSALDFYRGYLSRNPDTVFY